MYFDSETEESGHGNEQNEETFVTVGGMKLTTCMDKTGLVQFQTKSRMANGGSLCIDTQFICFVHRIEQELFHVAGKVAVFQSSVNRQWFWCPSRL